MLNTVSLQEVCKWLAEFSVQVVAAQWNAISGHAWDYLLITIDTRLYL